MREIEKKTNQIPEVVAGGCFDCKSMVTVHMHQECMSCDVYTVYMFMKARDLTLVKVCILLRWFHFAACYWTCSRSSTCHRGCDVMVQLMKGQWLIICNLCV